MLLQNSITGGRTKIGFLLERKLPQNAMVGKEPKAPKGPKHSSAMPFPTAVIKHEAWAAGWL